MGKDRLSQVLARIERACERAEAAAARLGDGGSADRAAFAQLEARHTRLRSRVEEAIGQLDELLGEAAGR